MRLVCAALKLVRTLRGVPSELNSEKVALGDKPCGDTVRGSRECSPAGITIKESVKALTVRVGCAKCEDAVADYARAMDH